MSAAAGFPAGSHDAEFPGPPPLPYVPWDIHPKNIRCCQYLNKMSPEIEKTIANDSEMNKVINRVARMIYLLYCYSVDFLSPFFLLINR